MDSGRESLIERSGVVLCVVFSHQGERLAWATGGNIIVWNLAARQKVLTIKGQTDPIKSLAFSADGQRIVSNGNHAVRIWDTTTGEETLTLLTYKGPGVLSTVSSATFSLDGWRIAAAANYWGQREFTVKVWDASPLEDQPREKAHVSER
jgi:WD40 repeat protein